MLRRPFVGLARDERAFLRGLLCAPTLVLYRSAPERELTVGLKGTRAVLGGLLGDLRGPCKLY